MPPQVPTGVGGVGTNKGGVAVSFRVCSSHLCFVNSHLAAHEGEHYMRQRNANAADISQHLGVGKVRCVVHCIERCTVRRIVRCIVHHTEHQPAPRRVPGRLVSKAHGPRRSVQPSLLVP